MPLSPTALHESNEKGAGPPVAAADPNQITFIKPFDAENPLQWSHRKKWLSTSVLSATTFVRITCSTVMAPALTAISADLHMSSVESTMALSVYLLASAFGPLVLSPLSELYGRQRVLHASNLWFLGWNILCGFATTKELLIASRALAGFGGSVAYALGSAVLGDTWTREERGRSLSLYLLIPLLGSAIGPTLGGYITQYASWRWIFWSVGAVQAGLVVFSFIAFSETYDPVILHRRAKHFRKTTGNQDLFTLAERLNSGRTVRYVLARNLSRPLRLLATHPVVQIISLIQCIGYGLLYVVLTSYADLWILHYNESVATSGLHYFALALGEVFGALFGGPFMDYAYRKIKAQYGEHDMPPEARLPVMLPGFIVAPMGFLLYGWLAQYREPWPTVDLGVVILALGLQLQGQPTQAYIIDSYPDHAGSATAASQLLRSLAAFAFPLFAPALYRKLGYGWANSVIALTMVGVVGPATLMLWRFGPALRKRAQSSH